MKEFETNTVMTVREISDFLRLTEATVYKLLQEGKLPGRKVGGQWRCSKKAIEGWFEVNESGQLHEESEKVAEDGSQQKK